MTSPPAPNACPNCGNIVGESEYFCAACGARLRLHPNEHRSGPRLSALVFFYLCGVPSGAAGICSAASAASAGPGRAADIVGFIAMAIVSFIFFGWTVIRLIKANKPGQTDQLLEGKPSDSEDKENQNL